MSDDFTALLSRAVAALESQVKLSRESQSDYRAARIENRKLAAAQASSAASTRALLTEANARQVKRDAIVDAELARLAHRDRAQTKLLAAANERQAETHELAMANVGARAPETVPTDWNESDAE